MNLGNHDLTDVVSGMRLGRSLHSGPEKHPDDHMQEEKLLDPKFHAAKADGQLQ